MTDFDPALEPVVRPVDVEIARIEGVAQLVLWACRHCSSRQTVIARFADGLPRAVEVEHELGCPDRVED